MKNWNLIAAAIICLGGSTTVSAGNECLTFVQEFHNADQETKTKGGCLYQFSSTNLSTYPWFWKIDSSKGCDSRNIQREESSYKDTKFCRPNDEAGKR